MCFSLIIFIPGGALCGYKSNLILLESAGNLFNQEKTLKLHTGNLW